MIQSHETFLCNTFQILRMPQEAFHRSIVYASSTRDFESFHQNLVCPLGYLIRICG